MVLDMVHPYMFPKTIVWMNVKIDKVNDDVKSDEVNYDVKYGAMSVIVDVDVHEQFTNK